MADKFKSIIIWITGGLVYGLIEIMWRGYTHWTMLLLAMCVSIPLDAFNEVITWDVPLWKQSVLGGTVITIAEFLAGVFLNICLGLAIWDYSNLPFNLLGQVCPQYWFAWCLLTMIAIPIFDWERYFIYKFFNKQGWSCSEELRPKYNIFKN